MHDILRALRRETDPELLRDVAMHVIEQNQKLNELIDSILEQQAAQAQQKLSLKDELKVLRKMVFGKSAEKRKRPEAQDRRRSIESQALLLHAQSLAPLPDEEESKDLSEEVHDYDLTEAEKGEEARLRGIADPQWEEIEGLYEESTEITVVERQYKKKRHRRKKYRLKWQESCAEGEEPHAQETIITAAGPEKLIPGAHYSIEFATTVVADKYLYHCPLNRQVEQMKALGLKGVTAKTLWNLCSAVAVHLEPIAEKIRREIISEERATHVDESPWPILDPQASDGYMWTASNQAGSYYQFEPTRSGKVLKDLLKGLKGTVLCDGFSGYKRLNKLEGVELAFCWAHVRRKFFDMEPNYPKECAEILDWIDELFEIERKARDWQELSALRQEESKAILEKLHPKLLEIKKKALPESGLAKAATYALKLWSGLKKFIQNSKIPLSNNDAERALRHAVMGRKNFYGSKTINGADVAATLYTIMESCKKVELDPKGYVEMAVRTNAQGKPVLTPLEYARKKRSSNKIAA